MRFKRLTLIGIATACAGLLVTAADQTRIAGAQAELRAAIDKADVDGDLTAAITQFQAIVDKYRRTDRVVAATALVHMAECYQKAGDAQARAAYERVVRDFGDLPSVAARARSRLAALTAAGRAAAPPALALRRVYDGPGLDWCNGLSSDVRWLSHVDWSTGNIAIADLTSGAVRPVTTGASINQKSRQFGECSIFSPDNRQLAYYWSAGQSELRVIGVDGSKPRTLFRAADYLRPLDWSRDGRSILLVAGTNDGQQLHVVSVSDGAARRIETPQNHSLHAFFSPDGRFIAYSGGMAPDPTKSDVFIVAADGTQATHVVRHPADDGLVGWSDDGGHLYFWSDRTGTGDVWSVTVENGHVRGAPALVKPNFGPLNRVRLVNGTLYHMVRSEVSEVYLASIDPEKGILLGAAAPAKPYATSANFAPDWSPDGRFLAYRVMEGAGDPWSHPRAQIAILDLATGQERVLLPSIASIDPNDGPKWSPDGKSLLVIGRQQTPDAGVHLVDVASGKTTTVLKVPKGQYLLRAVWARDGRSILYPTGSPQRIVRRELASGAEVELLRLDSPVGAMRIGVSPDGRTLAFTRREPGDKPIHVLSLMPTDGGPARELYRTAPGQGLGPFAWSPDGRYVYFPRRQLLASGERPPSASRQVWRATLDGRVEQVPMERPWSDASVTSFFVFSPDGRRIAFTRGESKAELWALENLTTPAKGGS